ncbi:MAG: DUF302 domain-containing protein [Bdellovibrionales bacterium]|nr:DUF302 domain-containing protein [Bdellovibrionales bacterium]
MPKTVILGACLTSLAFEAYQHSTDVALLIPCNVVVREVKGGQTEVKVLRPTLMLQLLMICQSETQFKLWKRIWNG